jgi:glycogen phosphorylase
LLERCAVPEPTDIAYFSMEIALDPGMPTYSGGLGVLAGDMLRSAADLSLRMVGVSLIHRKGHFFQRLDGEGQQREEPCEWSIDDFVTEQPQRIQVVIEGRTVHVRAWKYEVMGLGGAVVPVFLLDTDLPENSPEDRELSHYLYGGDLRYRLRQEALLGIGGVRMLRALGYSVVRRFHLNEGHSSLLTLELLREQLAVGGRAEPTVDDLSAVRSSCVFTTHTPIPAGHDRFQAELVRQVLGPEVEARLQALHAYGHELNMTQLALHASHYINGVAKRHGEVSRRLLASAGIDSITNGVHAPSWTVAPFQALFDRHIPGWREDNFSLRSALGIPAEEVRRAHRDAKRSLLDHVNRTTNAGMDLDVLTIGFARRATAYKRPELLFTDIERLKAIVARHGPLQVLYAGKAHPQDEVGKRLIQRVFSAQHALRGHVRVAYLENYDVSLARLLVAGVDVWLNTPLPPLEASGTSGMKAALNGVPSLSVLDGWWLEGCIEGVTGWAIGPASRDQSFIDPAADAFALYDKLESTVFPAFYGEGSAFTDIMRHAIALNGSFFNSQRMMQQYVLKAYFG